MCGSSSSRPRAGCRLTPRQLVAGGLTALTIPALVVGPPQGTLVTLWPSALAIALAFITRNIFGALFLGALAGSVLLARGSPWQTGATLVGDALVPAVTTPWNIGVLTFTLLIGGLVALLEAGDGMAVVARRLQRHAQGRRGAGLAIYAIGWLFFVDGLGNAMLVGKTMRPIADRAGISRAKLAFIVDTTASPIASVAFVSTWVAYEISVIREGFANVGPAIAQVAAPYGALIASLPYRFYPYFILLIALLAVLGRDIGPMRAHERAVQDTTGDRPGGSDVEAGGGSLVLALAPLLILLVTVVGGLWIDGGGAGRPVTVASLIETLGQADAARVFVWATGLTIGLTIGLMRLEPGTSRHTRELVAVAISGIGTMGRPALILILAWMLNGVIQQLDAASYLVELLTGRLPAALVPTSVFALAALMSFSTGTSWGTMAMVMPLAIPLAFALSGPTVTAATAGDPLVTSTIGAVLAGAVFGDHCSPISDTTIVSAFSTGCEVMTHVQTQLPYALMAGVLAIVCGYLPAGFGVSPWLLLPSGGAACWLWIRVASRAPDRDREA